MKITAFNGSPRANKGNTHAMVEAFLEGASKAGAETNNIFLSQFQIKHCLGCYSCYLRTPGKCAIKDDMQEIMANYMESDLVLYATPIYVYNITGLMKDFMDRLLPLSYPEFKNRIMGTPIDQRPYELQILSVAGLKGPEQFDIIKLLARKLDQNPMIKVVGEIYRDNVNQDPLNSSRPSDSVAEFLAKMRQSGYEMVRR